VSLVTLNTIQINGASNVQKIALNTEKIFILGHVEGKADFQFIPFTNRIERFLVEEPIEAVLNAPVQSRSTLMSFTAVSGALSIPKSNILKVYPHPSVDRCYMETLSGTTISVEVIKSRMETVVEQVNFVDGVPVGSVSMNEVGSPGDDNIVWDDLRFPASNVRISATKTPTWVSYRGGQVLSFSSSADNTVYFLAQLPHSWKEGSEIRAHIHYAVTGNGPFAPSDQVKWDLTYSWANVNDVFPSESTESVTATLAADYVANSHTIQGIVHLDGTGKGISSMLICSLTRDVSVGNDYAGGVLFIGIDIHFQADMEGSRQEYIK